MEKIDQRYRSADGHSEGCIKMFLKLFILYFGSFPANSEECVRTASDAQLDVWSWRFTMACTLADVFKT